MIGNGVGIAPMRAVCQEAVHFKTNLDEKKEASPYGDLHVFFGTRTVSDKLFDADFTLCEKLGVLKTYTTAYSRDSARPKQYVQEKLKQHKELIQELIKNPKARILVCGSTDLKKGVTKALEEIMTEIGQDQAVFQATKQGRILFECFG